MRSNNNKFYIKGVKFQVNTEIKYQQIIGFGGAFTDSAGINILSLSEPAQDLLLRYLILFSPLSSQTWFCALNSRLLYRGGK